jgi:hypothetical protein
MTATPPRADSDLRTLAAEAIREGQKRFLAPESLADAVLAAVLPEHRRMVLAEAAGAIEDDMPETVASRDVLRTAAELVRRLAAAAPPATLSATVPVENAPAVPEEADGQRRTGCVRCDTDQMALACHCRRECSSDICSAMDQTPAPGGFHEPDEPTAEVVAAFDAGIPGRTAPPRGQTQRLDLAQAGWQELREQLQNALAIDQDSRPLPSVPKMVEMLRAERDEARVTLDAAHDEIGILKRDLEEQTSTAFGNQAERNRLAAAYAGLCKDNLALRSDLGDLAAQVAHYQHLHEQPDIPDDLPALRRRVDREQAEQRVIEAAKAWYAACDPRAITAPDIRAAGIQLGAALDALCDADRFAPTTPERDR